MKYHKYEMSQEYALFSQKSCQNMSSRLSTSMYIHKHVTYYFRVKISVDFLDQGKKFLKFS
jgi:hypothetical protein